ncbi:E4 orf3 [Human adenovirus 41]|uniref:E4 orf3 n=1 Tax=Human adenovirus F serotype 41 TaxID=10524 RepID=A0A7U3NJH6_ADE41|nr:E4 orf3 [Human adenovirus 41]
MKVCLRMTVEGALNKLFELHGASLQIILMDVLRGRQAENYLGVIQDCSLMFEDFEENAFAMFVFLEVRVPALSPPLLGNLKNYSHFDLAVIFYQRSGGERCDLRDLHFGWLYNRLE